MLQTAVGQGPFVGWPKHWVEQHHIPCLRVPFLIAQHLRSVCADRLCIGDMSCPLLKHDPNQSLPFYQAHLSTPLRKQQTIAAKTGTGIQNTTALKLDTTGPHQVCGHPAASATLNLYIRWLIGLSVARHAKPHTSVIKK
jgi:hypothetical protein